jgi:small subunit ribosomal protein S8
MLHDPIADMFIRIKNAQATHKSTVIMPASKVKESILGVLKKNDYIVNFTRSAATVGEVLEVELRYNGKEPAISHLQRVSKVGARRYAGVQDIPRPLSGHGLAIVSTPKGMMSGFEAQRAGLGGEVIATVW